MAITSIQLKADFENHSIKAIPTVWPCKAWKLPRTFVANLPASLSDHDAEFDICGVYLLLSADSIYVGEAEQVITRLKQHHMSPLFDWDVALAFVSKEESLEKSHIKYLEHEIFKILKEMGSYTLINTSTPTRSHVGDEDTMQEYVGFIIKLSEVFGFGKAFTPPAAKAKTNLPEQPSRTASKSQKISESSFVEHEIKAQDIARKAVKYAMENQILSQKDVALLCKKENARIFKGGGVPLLKSTNGNPEDVFTGNHHNSYNHDIVCAYGKKYLISHELYNFPDVPQKDSRGPLLHYLVERGMTLEDIFRICQGKETTKTGKPKKK